MTKYCFILGTGRSGTYSIFKSLENIEDINVNHESNFDFLLWLGTLKFHRKISSDFIINELQSYKEHIDSGLGSGERFFDVSNALPLIIPELKEVFKDSTIVWVSRHAYKVVSSFYFKFEDLMYPKVGMQVLLNFLKSNSGIDELLPDKRSCRPLYSSKMDSWMRLRNICYHWVHYESLALDYSNLIDIKMKFEDISSDKIKIEEFLSFLGLSTSIVDMKYFAVPSNVAIPENFEFDHREFEIFSEICGPLNSLIGYNPKGYKTVYLK
jgi:hypothetical protein